MSSLDASPNMDPSRGLTRDECDALRTDLEAADIPIVRVDEPSPGVFWLTFRSPQLHVEFTVTGAARFREIVAAGLHPGLPASVFASQPTQREVLDRQPPSDPRS